VIAVVLFLPRGIAGLIEDLAAKLDKPATDSKPLATEKNGESSDP